MRTKYFLLFLFINLLFCTLSAQEVTLSGFVYDKETGESQIGAIILDKNSKATAVTNKFGFYSIDVPQNDTAYITVSYVGYNKTKKKIYTEKDKVINFHLSLTNVLEEIIVRSEKNITDRDEIGIIEIPISQIKTLPALGGETDIFKAIQLMPGIHSGSEGRNSLYVRGGSPDQNLILLDDVPLYYVSHLGGFVSVFNTDALKTVKVIKGGFPARYGGRLSSVIDIRMKDGNMKKYTACGTVGVITSKLSIQGPIVKDKVSFIVSGRRFLLDLISKPLTKSLMDGLSSGYTFYDLNAKINYKMSEKSRLFLSFYNGNDKISLKYTEDDSDNTYKAITRWGNTLIALRWNYLLSKKLFVNSTLSYTKYRYTLNSKFSGEDISYQNNLSSGIEDISFKTDFEYSGKGTIRYGLNSIYHTFFPDISNYTKTDNNETLEDVRQEQIITAWDNTGYCEYQRRFGFFSFNTGVRLSSYYIQNENFMSVNPSVILNFHINKKFSIKGSFVTSNQNIHFLTNSGTGVPSDLWMPAVKKAVPENAFQASLGTAQTLKKGKYEFTVEAYYKEMSDMISYKEGASFSQRSISWEDKLETEGKGKSYGIELLIQKKQGIMTGWIGYTLSKSERQFDNINFGNPYPFKYDRRHDVSFVFNYKLKKNIHFSATWVFSTGAPVTLPSGSFQAKKQRHFYRSQGLISDYYTSVNLYNGKHNYRMRCYHKLDIGISFIKKKRWGERTLLLSVYNIYNRQNPYYYYFDYEETETGEYEKKLYQKSLFPFIPSISYSFRIYKSK